jgi:hypothetical protein
MGLVPTLMENQAPAEAEAPQTMETEPMPNASPEEQAVYDMFVKKAAEIIYTPDGKVMPAILEALRVPPNDQPEGGSPPVMALANAAFLIVKKLDVSAIEQDRPLPDEILYHGGVEIVEELGEIASAAKIYDYSEEELSGALFQAVDLFRQHAVESGRTTEDVLKAQFGEIEEADKAGKLGEILPGLGGEPAVEAPMEPPPQ